MGEVHVHAYSLGPSLLLAIKGHTFHGRRELTSETRKLKPPKKPAQAVEVQAQACALLS